MGLTEKKLEQSGFNRVDF